MKCLLLLYSKRAEINRYIPGISRNPN